MTAFLHQQTAFKGITEVIHHLPDVHMEREDLIKQIVEEEFKLDGGAANKSSSFPQASGYD